MATQSINLQVQKRATGKGSARELRGNKAVPAIIYGSKVKNQPLSVPESHVVKYSGHGQENTIFKLQSDVAELNGVSVLMKKVDVHPVTRRPIHVDLFALDMTAEIRVNVELKFEGRPRGVAEEGGILQILLRAIEVECLPTNIPEFITADVSNLGLNEALHISDLQMPNGVKATSSGDLALASVTVMRDEEPAAAPAVATDAAAAATATPAAAPAAGAAKPEKKD